MESSRTGPDNISKPLWTPSSSWAIQITESCCTTSPGQFVIPEFLRCHTSVLFFRLFYSFQPFSLSDDRIRPQKSEWSRTVHKVRAKWEMAEKTKTRRSQILTRSSFHRTQTHRQAQFPGVCLSKPTSILNLFSKVLYCTTEYSTAPAASTQTKYRYHYHNSRPRTLHRLPACLLTTHNTVALIKWTTYYRILPRLQPMFQPYAIAVPFLQMSRYYQYSGQRKEEKRKEKIREQWGMTVINNKLYNQIFELIIASCHSTLEDQKFTNY